MANLELTVTTQPIMKHVIRPPLLSTDVLFLSPDCAFVLYLYILCIDVFVFLLD